MANAPIRLAVIVTLIAMAWLMPSGRAQEVPPMNIYGVAFLGGSVATNVEVTGYVNGRLADTTTTNGDGQYSIVVDGAANDRLTFQVHGRTAEQTASFTSGQSLALDLHARDGSATGGGLARGVGKEIPMLPAALLLPLVAALAVMTRRL